MDVVRFKFSERMTDNHEMNFYGSDHFQYGAARFIYTLAKFRQEAAIIQRLTSKLNADIRLKGPSQ